MENDPNAPANESTALALTEPSIEPLEELFDRDPLSLSQQDLDRIVAFYRNLRVKFKTAEEQGKPAPRASAPKKPAQGKLAAPPQLTLADLNIKF